MPFQFFLPRPLTPRSIRANAPAASGLYGISNAREWIYIGEADNIQATLARHLQHRDTAVMKCGPTGFVFELCEPATRPVRLERLVVEYAPFCNRHSPRSQ
ncbi:MAG: hypothetical protein ACE141_19460 [Bryobacteraceae bacterium]